MVCWPCCIHNTWGRAWLVVHKFDGLTTTQAIGLYTRHLVHAAKSIAPSSSAWKTPRRTKLPCPAVVAMAAGAPRAMTCIALEEGCTLVQVPRPLFLRFVLECPRALQIYLQKVHARLRFSNSQILKIESASHGIELLCRALGTSRGWQAWEAYLWGPCQGGSPGGGHLHWMSTQPTGAVPMNRRPADELSSL